MHIVFIDDNDDFRAVATTLLQNAGHVVRTGRNGREALRLLRATRTDLLITDIVMPEADGLGLIITVRREFPGLPVIAMSGIGSNTSLYLNMAAKLGAVATLAKPLSADELLTAIARVQGDGPRHAADASPEVPPS